MTFMFLGKTKTRQNQGFMPKLDNRRDLCSNIKSRIGWVATKISRKPISLAKNLSNIEFERSI